MCKNLKNYRIEKCINLLMNIGPFSKNRIILESIKIKKVRNPDK